MSRFCFLLVAVALIQLAGSGCMSPWWDDPPTEQGKVFAVGTVFRGKDKGANRMYAETDARGKLGAYIGTQVQSLAEVWRATGADAEIGVDANAYFNNEGLIRTLTNTKLMGAAPVKYGEDEKYYYVLMELDLDRFAELWKKTLIANAAESQFFKTQAMREAYSTKLDTVLGKYYQTEDYKEGEALPRVQVAVR